MLVPIPPTETQAIIAGSLEAIQRGIWRNVGESQGLTALRDTLLPKLLSREVSLPETMQTAEFNFIVNDRSFGKER